MAFLEADLSGQVAALALIIGSALLAVWIDNQLPRLSPGTFRGVGLHMVTSMLAVQIGMRVLGSVPREPAAVMTALFGAALPAMIYLLLAAFWLMKLMAGVMGRSSRPGSPH